MKTIPKIKLFIFKNKNESFKTDARPILKRQLNSKQ